MATTVRVVFKSQNLKKKSLSHVLPQAQDVPFSGFLGWFICMLPRCILYLTHLKLLNTFASCSGQESTIIFDSGLPIVICLSLVTKSAQKSGLLLFSTSVTFASVQGVFISFLAYHNSLLTKWPIVPLIVTLVLVVYWCLPISQTF